MKEFIAGLITAPEVLLALQELLLAFIAFVVAVALPWAIRKLSQVFKVQIEERHRKALHEAILTYSENAVRGGLSVANEAALRSLVAYLRQSVPDAVATLAPSDDVLLALLRRYAPKV